MTAEQRIKNLSVPAGPVDVVLDTDTYNEIDDQFALAYLLRSTEKLNTKAIYAAPFFNQHSEGPADGMERSYEEIKKILTLMGEEYPVFKGSDRYLENKDMSLISPDRTVDASTCLFPEKTWFIKNLTHDKTGDTKPLHFELLFGEEEATADNFRLPRFLIYDAETDSIIEDTTVFEEPYRESFGESAFRKFINFFTALLNFLTDLFKNKK